MKKLICWLFKHKVELNVRIPSQCKRCGKIFPSGVEILREAYAPIIKEQLK